MQTLTHLRPATAFGIRRSISYLGLVIFLLGACAVDSPDLAQQLVATTTETPAPTTTATSSPVASEQPTDSAPTTTVGPNGLTVRVQAIDNTFRAGLTVIEAGTELLFNNGGRNDHNVLLSDGSTEWGVATEDFGPGAEYRVVLSTPGTYDYYCSLHATPTAGMIGTIEVVSQLEDN